MRVIKALLLTVAGLLVFAIIVGALLPSEYTVTRSVDVQAPPAAVHTHVNDLELWPAWQPWADADPSIVVSRGATTRGVGASQSWTGDQGSGELTLTESSAEKGIAYDMLFDGQWKAKGQIQYTAVGDSTRVSWTMSGGEDSMPVLGGYFALMMDSMVGGMFDKGLAKLKKVVEQKP